MITEKTETTDGYFDKLIESMGERLSDLVMRVVESKLDRYFKSPAKITFTEKEAAAFLGISLVTLQLWRKDGLINYVHYPLARPS